MNPERLEVGTLHAETVTGAQAGQFAARNQTPHGARGELEHGRDFRHGEVAIQASSDSNGPNAKKGQAPWWRPALPVKPSRVLPDVLRVPDALRGSVP